MELEKLRLQVELAKLQLQLQGKTINNINGDNNTTNNTNNIQNITNNNTFNILSTEPIDPKNIDLSFMDIDHVRRGPKGVSDILLQIFKDDDGRLKYICVDLSRSTHKRLSKESNGKLAWKTDPGGKYVKNVLYPIINKQVREVVLNWKLDGIQSGTFNTSYDVYDDLTCDEYVIPDNAAKINRVTLNAKDSDNFHKKALQMCDNEIYISKKDFAQQK